MTRPAVIAGPGSYLPVGKQHALGRGLLGIAVLGHPQVGPADAVAAGDEAAERLGVARLAAHADAADPGAGRRGFHGHDRGVERPLVARRQLEDAHLKLAARDERAFDAAIVAVEAAAARAGIRRVGVRCQTRYAEAFRRLIARGYRVRWTDLRMTQDGYPEQPPAQGVLFSNWEI